MASDDIVFTKINLDVKLNGIFLHNETIQFAKTYQADDTVVFKYKSFIPSFAPSGKYGLTFNFINSDNKPEGCFFCSFDI